MLLFCAGAGIGTVVLVTFLVAVVVGEAAERDAPREPRPWQRLPHSSSTERSPVTTGSSEG